jgi:hypothetical protein
MMMSCAVQHREQLFAGGTLFMRNHMRSRQSPGRQQSPVWLFPVVGRRGSNAEETKLNWKKIRANLLGPSRFR